MKKFLAFLMAAIMLLSCTAALAEYDVSEHITFTVTNRGNLSAGNDYTGDEFYAWLSEKFNFDWEPMITDSATHDDTVALWINMGDMPDMANLTTFNYTTYCEWVDQGLLGALPDGWQEKYPNLAKVIANCGIEDYLTIDGKIYGLPATIFVNWMEMNPAVSHESVYYRKDWAEQLGYTFGETVTFEEMMKFCAECVEKDLAGNGTTIGMTSRNGVVVSHVLKWANGGSNVTGFVATDDGYVWGPCVEGVTDEIKLLRAAYESKALDPDFYMLASADVKNRFASGVAAAMFNDGGPGNVSDAWNAWEDAHPDTDADDYIATTLVTPADGKVIAYETGNFWTMKVFSPNTDEKTMDRILCMLDYFSDPTEGQIVVNCGIPNVDWQWTEDGVVDQSIKNPDKPKQYSQDVIQQWGTCNDELYIIKSPLSQPTAVEQYRRNMLNKSAGTVVRTDYDYSYYSSELKNQYSLDIAAKAAGLIADTTLDIDTEWAKFITENEGMWKPLLDELNQVFFNK